MAFVKKTVLSSIVCLVLNGCNTSPRGEIPFFETSLVENQSLMKPVRSISNFDDSLSCMDKLLLKNNVPSTYITSKLIPDASGKVFVSVKDMIVTSLSKMSRSSHAFEFVDFETDPLKQDTVQNITTLLLNSGDMHIPKPKLYVSGAITSMDQNVMTKGTGLGIASDDFELGMTSDLIATNFSLELHLGDFDTRTILPGIESANELAIAGKGDALDGGGRISKAGTQFSLSAAYSQGVGPATRALVDLGMIEVIGKWAEVPYWQCLSLDQTHPEFQREMHDWYREMSSSQQIEFFANALHSGGYLSTRETEGLSQELKQAILTFQKDEGIVITGIPNFETYEKIMRHYVTIDNNGRFKSIGWDDSEKRNKDNDNIWPDSKTNETNPLMINVELQPERKEYSVNENIAFSVQVNREAWLYCYYKNSNGVLTKIYPSVFQSAPKVDASRLHTIPPNNNADLFALTMSKPGQESVLCAATAQKLAEEKIPDLFKTDFTSVNAAFDNISLQNTLKGLSTGEITFGTVNWTVK
ncbi:DUF4384 domain-containing protein [Buttiauxella selenatireducens]|uniref:DUF4384 domain-containing protein n=1 Tax=Buttiauxella selenatireducens TaxID=3073902 RepID=A0ABY9S739_9ENTR|nr:DUF4384 domain-containing protein [Buttiauxella sp. R73]WMY72941.1 DUF4384 domain-containing protein [Buttiauxella sp. R73]